VQIKTTVKPHHCRDNYNFALRAICKHSTPLEIFTSHGHIAANGGNVVFMIDLLNRLLLFVAEELKRLVLNAK